MNRKKKIVIPGSNNKIDMQHQISHTEYNAQKTMQEKGGNTEMIMVIARTRNIGETLNLSQVVKKLGGDKKKISSEIQKCSRGGYECHAIITYFK